MALIACLIDIVGQALVEDGCGFTCHGVLDTVRYRTKGGKIPRCRGGKRGGGMR